MPRFGSIESRHGVNEPGYEPPPDRGERLVATGEKLQGAGKQMQSCGGSLVAVGCSGFVVLVIVFVVIALLAGGSSTPTTSPSGGPAIEAPSEEEQKNHEARVKEAEAEDEAIREGKRLKSEGRVSPEEEGNG